MHKTQSIYANLHACMIAVQKITEAGRPLTIHGASHAAVSPFLVIQPDAL
jgi:hypothetical protein